MSARVRLNFSNVASLLALFVALGSGTYAVAQSPDSELGALDEHQPPRGEAVRLARQGRR